MKNISYLDGTKLSATDAAQDGLYYAGSLVYRKQNGAFALEGAAFSGGRFVATNAGVETHYHLTDHLGSVRAIVNGLGEVVERNDYYPFGMRWNDAAAQTSDNRYRYNGKENQDFINVPYLDYGARMYDPRFSVRWNGPDLLAEKYYEISPYILCANDPISTIDLLGLDYWYTNDPNLIKNFFTNYLTVPEWDMSGWTHTRDSDFLANLSYNDKTSSYYYNYNTIEDGIVTVNGRVFKHVYAGEIKSVELNFWGKAEQIAEKTMPSRIIYETVDDFWIAIQSLFIGRTYPSHLNGNIVSPKEKLTAGINTLSSLAFNSYGKILNIPANTVNASQFNSMYKGTGITAASQSGQYIRAYNYVIKNNNEYNVLNPWVGRLQAILQTYQEQK